ncbi:MAG: DMT family transporter [Cyclobacteriaceae bacterium]
MSSNVIPVKAWVLLFILALIWGSSFILIKVGLTGLSAGQVGALRILSSSLFLLPVALSNIRKVNRPQIFLLLVVGFFGSLIPAFLFAAAQTRIQSSVAGILNALTPLFTLLLGVIFFSQRMSWRTFAGLMIGLGGTAYLFLAGSESGIHVNVYALLVVLATICYGANLNLIKFRIQDLSSRVITSISLLFVGPISAVYLFFFTDFTERLTAAKLWPVGAIFLLGIVGTALALILFNQLVKITTPVFTSSVTYIIPIVAGLWGIIDGEILRPFHFAGMALIILGVYIANKRNSK